MEPLEAIRRAARWDIYVQQGSSWERTLGFGDLDISALAWRGQIRRTHDSEGVLAAFRFELLDINTLAVRLTPADTRVVPDGTWVFDIEAHTVGDAFVKRMFEGQAVVTPEVTR